MNPWRWVDPRVGLVRLEGIHVYLRDRGWSQQSEPNPRLVRFVAPRGQNGNGLPYFVLPASEQLADFTRAVTDFITVLSEVEDRHPVVILEEILQSQDRATTPPAFSAK